MTLGFDDQPTARPRAAGSTYSSPPPRSMYPACTSNEDRRCVRMGQSIFGQNSHSLALFLRLQRAKEISSYGEQKCFRMAERGALSRDAFADQTTDRYAY